MFKDNKGAGNKSVKELGIKNIVGFIISALFLGFFVTATVVTIKAGQLTAGIFYLLIAVLVLVPHHRLRVTPALKYIIILILFFIVAAVNGKNNPTPEQKYEYFKLNDTFTLTVGDKTFPTVIKIVGQQTQLMLGEKIVTTTGYFLAVTGEITNTGSESVNFGFPKEPELKDAQGRNYSLFAKINIEGELPPNVAKSFSFVFEIPKDSTGLTFIIKDKTDIAKSIDLKR